MIDTKLIKQKITCIEVAQKCGLPVQRSGDRCKSPFHNGTNRNSMVVYDNYWRSYSDDMGGDCIDLWAALKCDWDVGQAIRDLAEMIGIKSDGGELQWRQATQRKCNQIETWHQDLLDAHREYLHKRKITDETIDALKIGSNRGRIIVPYYRNGYAYSWVGRAMNGQEPKYLKPKADSFTEYYPWGVHTLGRKSDILYVAEGCFDALSIYQEGFPVIASMGGYFGHTMMNAVIDICKGYKSVILTFDMDDAGRKFTESFGRALFERNIKFKVTQIPHSYKDISDYYTDGGKIKDLKLQDGMLFLAKRIRDKDKLYEFLFKAARHASRMDIMDIIASLKIESDISEAWLTEVSKSVYKAPPDLAVATDIAKKHELRFVSGVGFYEYLKRRGYWRLLQDDEMNGYIINELGMFATATKVGSVKTVLRPLVLSSQEFDKNPLANFINGTLELETGVFRAPEMDDMCSIQFPYAYDPDAKAPEWRKFIRDIAADDEKRIELLQFLAGYVLFQDCRHEKIFVLTGEGGNGKSRYTMVLEELFGKENVSNIPPSGLVEDFKLIHLRKSLLNIAGEIKSDVSGAEENLKMIASGQTVQACYKGKDHIEFAPRAKLVFACNGQLKASDTSNGLGRRLVIIDFPCKYVEDPDPADPLQKPIDINLLPKLLSELSGIFNWAYEGYKLLMQVGYFTLTDDNERLMQEFREASNPVLVFLRELLEDGCDSEMSNQDMYQTYQSWCFRTGHKPLANNKFHMEFKRATKDTFEVVSKRYRKNIGGRSVVCSWRGYKLIEDEPPRTIVVQGDFLRESR